MKNRCLRTGDLSHPKYGNPEMAPETKTLLNVWKHPLNPSFTSVEYPEMKMLPSKGYALVEDELAKRELDDTILSKENEILEQTITTEVADANNNTSGVVKRNNKNTLNADDIELPPSSQCGLAIATVAYKLD